MESVKNILFYGSMGVLGFMLMISLLMIILINKNIREIETKGGNLKIAKAQRKQAMGMGFTMLVLMAMVYFVACVRIEIPFPL